MSIIKSQISTRGDDFKKNVASMRSELETVQNAATRTMLGGNETARKRHIERGKRLPRDRVAGLLDKGSAFLEVAFTITLFHRLALSLVWVVSKGLSV